MQWRLFLVFIIFLITPAVARAAVTVTEISWMGSDSSANDEWIELYNDGADQDLSGWSIVSADGTPTIQLSGSIPGASYGLLERTDDTSEPGVAALLIYTGALGNDGEDLSLIDDSGATVQVMNFSSGWPAGDSVTKETMQLSGSSWITGIATPGSVTTNSTSTTTSDDDDPAETTSSSTSKSSSGNSSSSKPKYDAMAFELRVPRKALVGAPVFFQAQALGYTRKKMFKGKYEWNLGDGSLRTFIPEFHDETDFYYTYENPGTYVVTLKYYGSTFPDQEPDIVETFSVEVVQPVVAIGSTLSALTLTNESSRAIDLSGWYLRDVNGLEYQIPKDTQLLGDKTMSLSHKNTQLKHQDDISLLTPTRSLVATTIKVVPIVATRSYEPKTATLDTETEEVVGVITRPAAQIAAASSLAQKQKTPNMVVWVLSFIILILIAVVAVLLVRREDEEVEELASGYSLVD